MREKIDNLTILERIATGDKTAIQECVDLYGSLIWGLAVEFTNTELEAEEAALDIFHDIWIYAERFDPQKLLEKRYIYFIARHRMMTRVIYKQ